MNSLFPRRSFRTFAKAAAGILLFLVSPIHSQESGSILLYVRHGRTTHLEVALRELSMITEALQAEGYSVVTATVDGLGESKGNITFSPDLALEQVDLGEYRGVIFPCFLRGGTFTRWRGSEEEKSLARNAAQLDLPIAAQHGASILLCEAGLLEGRRFNAWIDDSYFKYDCYGTGQYTGGGPVSDGGIITSGYCEYAVEHHGGESQTEELMRLFIDAVAPAVVPGGSAPVVRRSP